MKNKKISIVIPVYNREKTIKRTFDCLAKQLNKNVEIIFVNDGSNDNSKKLIENFISNNKDYDIKIINQDNKGLLKTRGVGISYAAGEYIINLDAGDQLADNAVELILQEIETSNYDYYVINSLVEHENGKIEKRKFNNSNLSGVNNLLTGLCPYSICFKIAKKQFLVNSEAYSMAQDVVNGEDFCQSLDLMLKTTNGKLINDYLYIYIKDEGSLRATEKKTAFLKAIDYAKYRLEGKYKEELDYLIFTKTIMKIILEKNSNGDQELLQYYKSSNVHNNKYIKLKFLCEILAYLKCMVLN